MHTRSTPANPTYKLPRYMLLDLPRHVIRSVARLRLRVHTLALKQQLGIPPLSLLVT
jgi:hypothetical protein